MEKLKSIYSTLRLTLQKRFIHEQKRHWTRCTKMYSVTGVTLMLLYSWWWLYMCYYQRVVQRLMQTCPTTRAPCTARAWGSSGEQSCGHPKAPLGTHWGEFASWRPTEVIVGQVGPSLATPGAAGVRRGLEATSDKPSATRPWGQQQSCGDRPCLLLTAEQGATDTSDITHARLLQERCLVVWKGVKACKNCKGRLQLTWYSLTISVD